MNPIQDRDRLRQHTDVLLTSPSATEFPGRSSRTLSDLEDALPPKSRSFFDSLLDKRILDDKAAREFLKRRQNRLPWFDDIESLGSALIEDGSITRYQFDRLLSGAAHGLVLGNHRVLDSLGVGGMGVVFRAEHIFMKRQIAIKVLPVDSDCPAHILSRFHSEINVLASLHHPNIVVAYDSGEVPSPGPGQPALLYLAMELLPGGDLDQYVTRNGPVPIAKACDWIRQASYGLQEAHEHRLIHRDIKPSNLLLGKSERIKIVDFGLVQQFHHRQTEMGDILGTIEYMAPEQSRDSSTIGIAADIYGLGATLYRLLTGEPPYPRTRVFSLALRRLQNGPARRLRVLLPDAPPRLDVLLASMLDPNPAFRPGSAAAVSKLLAPFVE